MKFGLRYNRKINAVFLYIVLVLGIIHLAVYPGSRSKYVHAEREVLTYDATLYNQKKLNLLLLGEKDTTPPEEIYSSNYEYAYFKFDFKRNEGIVPIGKDEYTILVEPSNACTVEKISTLASTISNDKTQIQYDSNGVDTNTVILKCNVEKITKKDIPKDKISVSVKIKEKVNNKEFIYMSGNYTDTLENYYKKYPLPATGIEELNWDYKSLTIPSYLSSEFFDDMKYYLEKVDVDPKLTSYLPADYDYNLSNKNVYGIFKEIWMDNIIGKYSGNGDANKEYEKYYETYIKEYIEKNITDVSGEISLPGMKVTHTTTDQGIIHKFEIEENLIGYARTAKEATEKTGNMYFSTEEKEAIDKAFEYYIEKYTYLNGLTENNKELIKEYVKTFDPTGTNGMGYILTNGTTVDTPVPGTIVLGGEAIEGMRYYEGGQLKLLSTIIDYANIKVNKELKISFGYPSDMLPTFRYGLKTIYKDIISEETIKEISGVGHAIRNAVIKNNTANGGTGAYSETFKVLDKTYGWNLEVKVYSDGNHTYVTVKKLETLSWDYKSLIVPEYDLNESFFNDLKNNLSDLKLTSYLPADYDYNLSNKNVYGIFKEIWMDNIIGKYSGNGDANKEYEKYYETYIKEYIEKNITDVSGEISLPGMKVTHTTTDQGIIHKFEIEENLIGYARTAKEATEKTGNMYFSTEEKEAIDKAFEYYIEKYTYLNGLTENNKELIKEYVKTFDPTGTNGMGYILTNGTTVDTPVPGTIVLGGEAIEGMRYYEGGQLKLLSTIIDYANIKVNKELKISFGYPSDMLPTFRYGLKTIYKDIISEETIKEISGVGHAIRNAVIKNNTANGGTGAYSETFKVLDKTYGWNLEVKVYSDGNHTYVTVKKLENTLALKVVEDQKETKDSEERLEETLSNVSVDNSKNVEQEDSCTDSEESAFIDTEKKEVLDNQENTIEADLDETSKEDTNESSSSITDISFEEVESPPEVEVEPPVVPSETTNGIESISETITPINTM